MMKRLLIGIAIFLVSIGAFFFLLGTPEVLALNPGLTFENELHIPPMLEYVEENGRKVFDLTIQEGISEFLPGLKTPTWGINGPYLGPVIRVDEGDEVLVNVTNALNETLTLHWHGMHIPAEMDGGPHQPIAAGEVWRPTWTIRQQATMLWYHPHMMGKTAEHVYNGVTGLFIIDDENAKSLDIPQVYGVDDIPLIIQDRQFADDGTFVYQIDQENPNNGVLGDTILVNGTHNPYVDVPARMVRFRILNASNSRFYQLAFSDNRTFHQIGTDGGLLEAPVPLTELILTPAERADIVVDMSNGEDVVLLSRAMGQGESLLENTIENLFRLEKHENVTIDILQIRPKPTEIASPPLPTKLNTIERWEPSEADQVRFFNMDAGTRGQFYTINGVSMDMERIDVVAKVGDVEIWEIFNDSTTGHSFHIHDVQFLILERTGEPDEPGQPAPPGEPPALNERGWKDTVLIHEDETVRLMMQFKDYANSDYPYMYHCHMLEHEDAGMMGQFVVVEEEDYADVLAFPVTRIGSVCSVD